MGYSGMDYRTVNSNLNLRTSNRFGFDRSWAQNKIVKTLRYNSDFEKKYCETTMLKRKKEIWLELRRERLISLALTLVVTVISLSFFWWFFKNYIFI